MKPVFEMPTSFKKIETIKYEARDLLNCLHIGIPLKNYQTGIWNITFMFLLF